MTLRTTTLTLGLAFSLATALAAGCTRAPKETPPSGITNDPAAGIWGSKWRLEEISSDRAIGTVEATLEFPKTDRAAGNASCNQFSGAVEITGKSIKFGPLVSTKMACSEAIMAQEANYLKALEDAVTFSIEGHVLLMYSTENDRLLRFSRRSP